METDRLGTFAVVITVAIMYLVLTFVTPMLSSLSSTYQLAAIGAGVLGSMALYRSIAALLFSAFQKSLRFRKLMLGPKFVEGTWVGCFQHGDSYHFTVEFMDQETGQTKITGREFDGDGNKYASWVSNASSIDTNDRRLIYAYSCDIYKKDKQQKGLGVFDLMSPSKKKPPNVIEGYVTDLVGDEKNMNKEHKISDGVVPDDEAIKEAKNIFLNKGERSDT